MCHPEIHLGDHEPRQGIGQDSGSESSAALEMRKAVCRSQRAALAANQARRFMTAQQET
jgi:hypothetical protein